MISSQITLEKPQYHLVDSYLSFVDEMKAFGDKVWEGMFLREGQSKEDFVDEQRLRATEAAPGMVHETLLWAVLDNVVVGRISLRHYLNENLKEFGGHIGYEVRPSARNKGIAKSMLKLLLQMPEVRNIGRVLLTCAPTNVASIKTIVANGGVLEKTIFVEKINRDTSHYWIDLSGK